jgi:hypothetical protein
MVTYISLFTGEIIADLAMRQLFVRYLELHPTLYILI